MTTEYKETQAEPDDAEGRVLEGLAQGEPYVFIVATLGAGDIDLRVAIGGGLQSASGVRSLLEKTLAALP